MLGNEASNNYRPAHTEIQIQMNVHIVTDSPGEIQYHSGFIAGGKMSSTGAAIINGPTRTNMIQPAPPGTKMGATPSPNASMDGGYSFVQPPSSLLDQNSKEHKDALSTNPGTLLPARALFNDPTSSFPKIVPLNTSAESLTTIDPRPQSGAKTRVSKLPETDNESIDPFKSDGEQSQKSQNNRHHHHHHHRHKRHHHKCQHRLKEADRKGQKCGNDSDTDLNVTTTSDRIRDYLNTSKNSDYRINDSFNRSPDTSFNHQDNDDSAKNKALLSKYAPAIGGLGDFLAGGQRIPNFPGEAFQGMGFDDQAQLRKAIQMGSPTASVKQINDVIKQLTQNLGIVPMGGTGTTASRRSSSQNSQLNDPAIHNVSLNDYIFNNPTLNYPPTNDYSLNEPSNNNNDCPVNDHPITKYSPDDELLFNQELVVLPSSDLNLIAEFKNKKQHPMGQPVTGIIPNSHRILPPNTGNPYNLPPNIGNVGYGQMPNNASESDPYADVSFNSDKNAQIGRSYQPYNFISDSDKYYTDANPKQPNYDDDRIDPVYTSGFPSANNENPLKYDIGIQGKPDYPNPQQPIVEPMKYDVGVQGTTQPPLLLAEIEFGEMGVQTGGGIVTPLPRKSLLAGQSPVGNASHMVSMRVGPDAGMRSMDSRFGGPRQTVLPGSKSTTSSQTDDVNLGGSNLPNNQPQYFNEYRPSVDSTESTGDTPSTENNTLTRDDTEPFRASSPTHTSMLVRQQAPLTFRKLETTPVIYQEFVDMEYPQTQANQLSQSSAVTQTALQSAPVEYKNPPEPPAIQYRSPAHPNAAMGASRPPNPPPLPPHRVLIPAVASDKENINCNDYPKSEDNTENLGGDPLHGVQNIVAEFEKHPDSVIPLPSKPFYRDFAGRSSFIETVPDEIPVEPNPGSIEAVPDYEKLELKKMKDDLKQSTIPIPKFTNLPASYSDIQPISDASTMEPHSGFIEPLPEYQYPDFTRKPNELKSKFAKNNSSDFTIPPYNGLNSRNYNPPINDQNPTTTNANKLFPRPPDLLSHDDQVSIEPPNQELPNFGKRQDANFPELSSFLRNFASTPFPVEIIAPSSNLSPQPTTEHKVELPTLSKAPNRRYPEKPYFTESIPDKPYSTEITSSKTSLRNPDKTPGNGVLKSASKQPMTTEITSSIPAPPSKVQLTTTNVSSGQNNQPLVNPPDRNDDPDDYDTTMPLIPGFADISYGENRVFGVPLATIPEAATPSDRSSCDFEPFVIPILDHEPRRYMTSGGAGDILANDVIVGSRGLVNNFIDSNPGSLNDTSDSSTTVTNGDDERGDGYLSPELRIDLSADPLGFKRGNERSNGVNSRNFGGNDGDKTPEPGDKGFIGGRDYEGQNRDVEQFQIRIHGHGVEENKTESTSIATTEIFEQIVEEKTTIEEFNLSYTKKQASPVADRRHPTLLELTKMLQDYEKSDGELPLIDDVVKK